MLLNKVKHTKCVNASSRDNSQGCQLQRAALMVETLQTILPGASAQKCSQTIDSCFFSVSAAL